MSRAEKYIVAAVVLAVSVYVLSEIAFWRCALGQGSTFQVPSSRAARPATRKAELICHRGHRAHGEKENRSVSVPSVISVAQSAARADDEPHEALAEVNALRRARGLRPFVFDEALTRGAKNVARFRARRLIEGHTADDFRGLPRGVRADAAGCAAWRGNDWGSCCTFDAYRFAGAAWCRGRDGRRYMHLFVRR